MYIYIYIYKYYIYIYIYIYIHRSYVEPCTTLYMYCDTVISWCRCMMFIMHVCDIDVPEVTWVTHSQHMCTMAENTIYSVSFRNYIRGIFLVLVYMRLLLAM